MIGRAILGAGVLFFAACGVARAAMSVAVSNCGHTVGMQKFANVPTLAGAVGIAPQNFGTDRVADNLAAWRLET